MIYCYTRDYEILVEATMDQVKNRTPIWAKKYFDNEAEAQKVLPDIIDADPTIGKYSEWLIRQWKTGTAKFPNDTDKLQNLLKTFDSKKTRLKEKDINRYNPDSLEQALEEQLDLTQSELKAARAGSLVVPPGSKIVIKNGPYSVVKASSPKAVMILSGGTKWCTANEVHAKHYLEKGPLYFIYKDGKRSANFSFEKSEYRNVENQELESVELRDVIKVFKPLALDNAKIAMEYAKIAETSPEVEEVIAKDPATAFEYARYIVKGRWPKAEPTIMRDPKLALEYTRDIIKGRWPEAEPTIMTSPAASYGYAFSVIKGRWPEAEPTIMKNLFVAIDYALFVIKGRWPEAEPTIMRDPRAALDYAYSVIRGRWPEAEPTIMRDPRAASNYALDVIKGRWPEAEPIIMSDPEKARVYKKHFYS